MARNLEHSGPFAARRKRIHGERGSVNPDTLWEVSILLRVAGFVEVLICKEFVKNGRLFL